MSLIDLSIPLHKIIVGIAGFIELMIILSSLDDGDLADAFYSWLAVHLFLAIIGGFIYFGYLLISGFAGVFIR